LFAPARFPRSPARTGRSPLGTTRQAPSDSTLPTASIASVWTATAANAIAADPEAVIGRPAAAPEHSGINAGTSIRPAPCADDIVKDQSARPACPAVARALPARAERRRTTTTTSSAPASICPATRSIDTPKTTAAATSAIDDACPTPIGTIARNACRRSRERRPEAAAKHQPVAGFSP
jgi:hypothetical protein